MTEPSNRKDKSYAERQTRTIAIMGILLPFVTLAFGQLGSYLQYLQTVSFDQLIFTAIFLTLLGCLPVSILIAVVIIISAKFQSENYNVLRAILVISYFIILPWAIYAGRCTIF
ncbi:hypothetical protein Pan54_49820 [Rubinisphaera italica]|uniref:Uncharacterized protein n=1 Tax=Rubinisphaera italica TaxID=2527969 RepID=A0A5C5XP41_9PLAN|nr:hypothetical protein Pan54_49820 [Rubinisphaera italica]